MNGVSRFLKAFPGSYFLFGPRGTGKTTWLKHTYPHAAWIDLLHAGTYRTYLAKPERLGPFVEALEENSVCVIDEIQRVPELLSMVHKLMEEKPSIQFLLTGSSSRKLKRTGVDLLAGRAVWRKMHPFMAAELGKGFNLEKSLKYGTIPLVHEAQDSREVLDSYINLYLEEEVMQEGLVRNLQNFSRFLETISFSQGSQLTISEISRECQVQRTTVHEYVSILEDLLIAHRLPVFSRRAKRRLSQHNKFYFFDCGLYTSLRPYGPLDKREELTGPALEGLVFQHLQAWIDYTPKRDNLYFWRTSSGLEVNFVIYGESGFWAVEVKNSETIRSKDLKPLNAFMLDYPEATALFLYRGKDKIKMGNILCLPVREFLLQLLPGHSL